MLQQSQDTEELRFMSKITDAFKNGKAFIPFVTAGDPCLEVTEQLLIEMDKTVPILLKSVFLSLTL